MRYFSINAWEEDGRSGGSEQLVIKVNDSHHDFNKKDLVVACMCKYFWVAELISKNLSHTDFDKLIDGTVVKRSSGNNYLGWSFSITPSTENDYDTFLRKDAEHKAAQKQIELKRQADDKLRAQKRKDLIQSALSKLTSAEISALGFESWRPE